MQDDQTSPQETEAIAPMEQHKNNIRRLEQGRFSRVRDLKGIEAVNRARNATNVPRQLKSDELARQHPDVDENVKSRIQKLRSTAQARETIRVHGIGSSNMAEALMNELRTYPDWMSKGACVNLDPDADGGFHRVPYDDSDIDFAQKICQGCKVREDCEQYADTHKVHYGVWGGYYYYPEDDK